MRTAFIETACELAEQNERIWLLTGDVGYSVLEGFASRFPERFVNVGVAEQNMTGVAAGLALCGKVIFTYSIANFPTMRCLEHIRNDVCYHNLNVKIVAVGGGLAYGSAGYTHHAVEDLAVMRLMPNMTVVAPGDPVETRLATKAIVNWPGPCYLRLGKAGEPAVHRAEPRFQIGKALVVREGSDVTLISTGGMLVTALEVSDLLAANGVSPRVLSMHTLKPLDVDAVRKASEQGLIVTIEEHTAIGGLGSAVSEVLATEENSACLVTLNAGMQPVTLVGSQLYLRRLAGLETQSIAHTVLSRLTSARRDCPVPRKPWPAG